MAPRPTYLPSDPLVDLVLAPVRTQATPEELATLRISFRTHLANSVLGLLNAMARSLQDTEQPASYPLVSTGAFSAAFQRALLSRVKVPPANRARLFELLATDLESASARDAVHGQCWTLERSAQRVDLRVYAARPVRPIEAWEQAL